MPVEVAASAVAQPVARAIALFTARLDSVNAEIELITCSGELGLAAIAALDEAVTRATRHCLTVDLTDAEFIAAAGIHRLIAARRRYPRGCLSVAAPPGPTRQVLSTLDLEGALLVCDTVDTSLAALDDEATQSARSRSVAESWS
jgi:hypothetical protein